MNVDADQFLRDTKAERTDAWVEAQDITPAEIAALILRIRRGELIPPGEYPRLLQALEELEWLRERLEYYEEKLESLTL